ncbi:MAG: 50S ribosomal protein L4 [bacterium]|nr:50S ribosomal protein L4 [bacterium]
MAAKPKYSVPTFTKSGAAAAAEVSLPVIFFAKKPGSSLLSQAVRVYLSNQRTAQAKTQTRAEVNRTTKKIYKQKGTGGARHGSRKAPIYVGGGVAHGPRGMQNYKMSLSAPLRKLALSQALSAKFVKKEIFVADVEKVEAKSKALALSLKKMKLSGKVTLVHSGSKDLIKAGQNLKDLRLVQASNFTTYDCLVAKNLLLTNESLPILEKRLTK